MVYLTVNLCFCNKNCWAGLAVIINSVGSVAEGVGVSYMTTIASESGPYWPRLSNMRAFRLLLPGSKPTCRSKAPFSQMVEPASTLFRYISTERAFVQLPLTVMVLLLVRVLLVGSVMTAGESGGGPGTAPAQPTLACSVCWGPASTSSPPSSRVRPVNTKIKNKKAYEV